MSKTTSLIALKVFVGIMQQLAIVQGIVVERNLHSYYRLPIAAVRRSNATNDYFILQCPFKASLNIPKPKDMDICTIAGRYSNHNPRDEGIKPVMELALKPKSNLQTKAEHRNLKPPKKVKWIKIKKRKPQTMMLMKPFKMKEYYKRPKTEIREQYKATNVRLFLDHPKTSTETKITVNGKPVQVHDSMALSSSAKPKIASPETKSTVKGKPVHQVHHDSKALSSSSVKPKIASSQTKIAENGKSLSSSSAKPSKIMKKPQEKRKTTEIKDYIEDDFTDATERVEHSDSPLKYLGAQEVLTKLQLQQRPSPTTANVGADKTEKFFAESNKYKKGFKTKGYQNMYHRDEIYQDHIFYDDLQQMGNYDVHKKTKQML